MKLDTRNCFSLEGVIVSILRKNEIVHARLYYKKKPKDKNPEYVNQEMYVTVSFWGGVADAVEDQLVVEDYVNIWGEIQVWPPEGQESQIRLKGLGFKRG